MSIVVQKYGGSSVADVSKLRQVAARVMRTRALGHDVVVVVSAMGDTTDELLSLAKQVSANPDRRELDMLLTAGERISMALLSIAIRELGGDAISFTGSQSGIITNDRHVDARIIEVRRSASRTSCAREDRRHRRLSGRVVPPRGDDARPRRQRHDRGRDGRRARRRILRDLLGRRRRLHRRSARRAAAQRIGTLSYEETQELAESGAKVLNAQAVEFAKEAGSRSTRGRPPRRCPARSVGRRHRRPQARRRAARTGRRRRQRTGRARAPRQIGTRSSARAARRARVAANSCTSATAADAGDVTGEPARGRPRPAAHRRRASARRPIADTLGAVSVVGAGINASFRERAPRIGRADRCRHRAERDRHVVVPHHVDDRSHAN
jgi:aspartate kinase